MVANFDGTQAPLAELVTPICTLSLRTRFCYFLWSSHLNFALFSLVHCFASFLFPFLFFFQAATWPKVSIFPKLIGNSKRKVFKEYASVNKFCASFAWVLGIS